MAQGFIFQRVTGASVALICSTVQDSAQLIHAKLTHAVSDSKRPLTIHFSARIFVTSKDAVSCYVGIAESAVDLAVASAKSKPHLAPLGGK
jgi:hypothetical protein